MKKWLLDITPATWITISRFLFIPLVLTPLLTGRPDGNLIAFCWFLLAMLSDSLDGMVARRFNQVSDLGKFLDPLADKMLMLPVLLVLSLRGLAPLTASLVILLREAVVVIWRWQALRQGRSFSATWASKIKTDCQTVGISLLLIGSYLPWPKLAGGVGVFAIHMGAFMAVFSALDYIPPRRVSGKKAVITLDFDK